MRRRFTSYGNAVLAAFAALLAICVLTAQPGVARAPSIASRVGFTGYVVDQAKLFDRAQRAALTEQLDRFERETRHQLAVVTLTRLGGRDIARVTRALANRWGVGRRGFNDGIVVLVAPNERKIRIAVGRGLENRLSDAFCKDVIDREIIPQFAVGKFGAGVEAGVTAIIRRLKETSVDNP